MVAQDVAGPAQPILSLKHRNGELATGPSPQSEPSGKCKGAVAWSCRWGSSGGQARVHEWQAAIFKWMFGYFKVWLHFTYLFSCRGTGLSRGFFQNGGLGVSVVFCWPDAYSRITPCTSTALDV